MAEGQPAGGQDNSNPDYLNLKVKSQVDTKTQAALKNSKFLLLKIYSEKKHNLYNVLMKSEK